MNIVIVIYIITCTKQERRHGLMYKKTTPIVYIQSIQLLIYIQSIQLLIYPPSSIKYIFLVNKFNINWTGGTGLGWTGLSRLR